MHVLDLKQLIENRLGVTLRRDHIEKALGRRKSGIEVQATMAVLKDSFGSKGGDDLSTPSDKMTVEEFVREAMDKLIEPPYKGMHVVFTGFNEAFRAYFPDKSPRAELDKLVEEGVIVVHRATGGAIAYWPDNVPLTYEEKRAKKRDRALGKMGLK